jgi:anti-anti-sigma regulatory factor
VTDEVLRIIPACDRPGLIIAGEVDESGYPLLLRRLAALDRRADVHIDLGGIEFCDLAGLRAIVRAGQLDEDAGPGGRVCLHAVPPRLRKILNVLGWDDIPGVAFDEEPLTARPAAARPAGRPQAGDHAPDAEQPACQ